MKWYDIQIIAFHTKYNKEKKKRNFPKNYVDIINRTNKNNIYTFVLLFWKISIEQLNSYSVWRRVYLFLSTILYKYLFLSSTNLSFIVTVYFTPEGDLYSFVVGGSYKQFTFTWRYSLKFSLSDSCFHNSWWHFHPV